MMRVKEERGGWFIEAETSDEQQRLQWLIESLKSHPDQRPAVYGSGAVSDDGVTPITEGQWRPHP